MDFINKIGDTLGQMGKDAADKAKELKEIAVLKSQISACEEVIDKNYAEIGRRYYEKYGDVPESDFAKQCNAIRNAEHGVEELQKQLRELREA